MGQWRQTFEEWQIDWETQVCVAPGCAAHVAVLLREQGRRDGWPLCPDCADEWLDRICARDLARRAGVAVALSPAYG